MRGTGTKQASMLCLMSPETVVPLDHPIRRIKELADGALAELGPVFDAMYGRTGRPSIPPERLLKSTLLIAFYSVRSERQRGSFFARWWRHAGYPVSQRIRKRVEEIFGWMKTIGNFRKTRYVGLGKNQLAAHMIGAAYNLLRIAKLLPASLHRVLARARWRADSVGVSSEWRRTECRV